MNRSRSKILHVAPWLVALALAACATPSDDPHPEIRPGERMSLQNECVKIADRGERERCLEKAAFAETY